MAGSGSGVGGSDGSSTLFGRSISQVAGPSAAAVDSPSAAADTASAANDSGSQASTSHLKPHQTELVKVLKIDDTTLIREWKSLRYAWAKYLECKKTVTKAKQLHQTGQWPSGLPKYNENLIVEIFIAKSSWGRYKSAFTVAECNPDMVDWLNSQNTTEQEDRDLWKSYRKEYMLADLQDFLDNGALKDIETAAEREKREKQEKEDRERREREEREEEERQRRERDEKREKDRRERAKYDAQIKEKNSHKKKAKRR